MGFLPAVPRGELRGLVLACWTTLGAIIDVTGEEAVVKDWDSKLLSPSGDVGDLWASLGQAFVQ